MKTCVARITFTKPALKPSTRADSTGPSTKLGRMATRSRPDALASCHASRSASTLPQHTGTPVSRVQGSGTRVYDPCRVQPHWRSGLPVPWHQLLLPLLHVRHAGMPLLGRLLQEGCASTRFSRAAADMLLLTGALSTQGAQITLSSKP